MMAKYKASYSIIYEIEGILTEEDMKLIEEEFKDWLYKMSDWIVESFAEFIKPRLKGRVDEYDCRSKVEVRREE